MFCSFPTKASSLARGLPRHRAGLRATGTSYTCDSPGTHRTHCSGQNWPELARTGQHSSSPPSCVWWPAGGRLCRLSSWAVLGFVLIRPEAPLAWFTTGSQSPVPPADVRHSLGWRSLTTIMPCTPQPVPSPASTQPALWLQFCASTTQVEVLVFYLGKMALASAPSF